LPLACRSLERRLGCRLPPPAGNSLAEEAAEAAAEEELAAVDPTHKGLYGHSAYEPGATGILGVLQVLPASPAHSAATIRASTQCLNGRACCSIRTSVL
jgi:hypothetical protein